MNKLMIKNRMIIVLLLVILSIISLAGCKTESNEASGFKISHVIIGVIIFSVVGLLNFILKGSKCPHYLEPEYGNEKSKCILMRSLEYPDLNNWYDEYCVKFRGEKRCYFKNNVERIRKHRGY